MTIEEILEQLKKLVEDKVKKNKNIDYSEIVKIVNNLKIPVLSNKLINYFNKLNNVLAKVTKQEVPPFKLNLKRYLQKRLYKYEKIVQNELKSNIYYKLKKTGIKIAKEVAEGEPFEKALNKNMLNVYADGILNIETKKGVMDAEAYNRMVANTELQHGRVEVQKERTKQYNYDLVIIQVQSDGCDICGPFENEIISLNGQDPNYQTLDSIEAQGFLHPNCRCELLTYLPDLDDERENEFMFEKDREKKAEDRDWQRYLERQIRENKRKEALTVGDESAKYKQKVSDYQKRMREFIKETGRVREYERER